MITGTVESQSKKEVKTKFGMKPTWSLKIDGEWYACGFTDPRVTAGDVIAFSFTEGKYGKEIDKGSIMKTGAAPATPTYTPVAAAPKSAAPVGNRQFPIPPLHGDRAIIRQNALSHASRLVCELSTLNREGYPPVSMDEYVDLTISIARRFEAYACGDLDVAKAKEIAVKKTLEAELGE